jgi:hypothetical protein
MSEEVDRAPWEQLPDEPLPAYRRFLIYRNLGPGRSLDRAYEVKKGKKARVSGLWTRESTKYRWKDRATAWDIDNMAGQGASTVINFIKAMDVLSSKAMSDALKPEREIKNLDQLLSVLNVIGSFITPEVIEAAKSLVAGDFVGQDQENG